VHPDVLAACDAMIATRVTDSREVAALTSRFSDPATAAAWTHRLADLSLGRAVFLPNQATVGTEPRSFRVLPRLSPHVRHRHKYLDVPIPEQHAFVFTGWPERRVRTLSKLCRTLSDCPTEDFERDARTGAVTHVNS
jgi:hypothetical protein